VSPIVNPVNAVNQVNPVSNFGSWLAEGVGSWVFCVGDFRRTGCGRPPQAGMPVVHWAGYPRDVRGGSAAGLQPPCIPYAGTVRAGRL